MLTLQLCKRVASQTKGASGILQQEEQSAVLGYTSQIAQQGLVAVAFVFVARPKTHRFHHPNVQATQILALQDQIRDQDGLQRSTQSGLQPLSTGRIDLDVRLANAKIAAAHHAPAHHQLWG